MKNKKSLLSLGLFALILVLGVGYALVNEVVLNFDGTATVADTQLKVDIASVEDSTTGDASITHTLTSSHADSDTFTITDMALNETITMIYTIDNHETDVDATLAEKITLSNNNEEFFSANYVINNPEIPAMSDGVPGTTTVTVTVSMIKTPVTAEDGTAEIEFSLEAAPVEN